ncbi:hypothetical protein TCE0_015f01799 [Talaromyces pinophilus]|uniref:Uncharacterized protein n=1 Tax=Talaromyces pinophilus TaxID=128442 RepID=A0A6V8GZ15_TALPI|nr:hypothetical protein TCE0_015f01799 [Talaromyces pinophilus]
MAVLQRNPHQPTLLAQYPLVKYSYAETSSDQHGPISWTHVQSNDLNAIFESEPVQQNLRLRVVRAREQLEDIDLNDFAHEASQQSIARQRNTKPLVALLVKDPCLAFRFPSSRDQMHRFQLKFVSSRDYREALDIFRKLNCPFSETSSDHIVRSASSRPESSSSRIINSTTPAFNGSMEWVQNQGHSGVPSSPPSFMPEFLTRNATNAPVLDESQKDHLGARTFSQIADPRTQESERPITSPSFDSQALEQVLPPKRDLPFSKPGPRLSNISSRPEALSESANSLDTLNAAVTKSSRPGTALSRVTVPATSSPARQLRLELEDSRRGSINQEQGQLPRGQVPVSSPLLETSAFGLSSPGVGNTISRHNTTTQSPRVPSTLSPVQTKSPLSFRQDQQQYSHNLNNVNATTTSPAPYAPVMNSGDLSAYLTTPESERSQLVNNWICQQLEDDSFRALCQDVERVWQRIAFGSRNAV